MFGLTWKGEQQRARPRVREVTWEDIASSASLPGRGGPATVETKQIIDFKSLSD